MRAIAIFIFLIGRDLRRFRIHNTPAEQRLLTIGSCSNGLERAAPSSVHPAPMGQTTVSPWMRCLNSVSTTLAALSLFILT